MRKIKNPVPLIILLSLACWAAIIALGLGAKAVLS